MKWLVVGLSVITVTVWGLVLFLALDVNGKEAVHPEKHDLITKEWTQKNANFIFDRNQQINNSTNEKETSPQSEKDTKSLEQYNIQMQDKQSVSIDDVLASLDLSVD